MSGTRKIKNRIKSARSIAKVTKAMEMMSASKMGRAQKAAISGRPYSERLGAVAKHLASSKEASENQLFKKSNLENELTVVIAPERGLCGSLISNLEREIAKKTGSFISVGSKARQLVIRKKRELVADFSVGLNIPTFEKCLPIARFIVNSYRNNEFGKVSVIYTHFINTLKQQVTEITILPLKETSETPNESKIFLDYVFEPESTSLLEEVVLHFLETEIYHRILEAYASEQSARMVAMKNATENADGIILDQTLLYNKVRQSEITNEIADLVKGSYE